MRIAGFANTVNRNRPEAIDRDAAAIGSNVLSVATGYFRGLPALRSKLVCRLTYTLEDVSMAVQIVATRDDHICPNLERELQALGVSYELLYVEEHPELVEQYKIRHSPNVIVDGELVFRKQPTEDELRSVLGIPCEP
jgi:glutaredoxin